MATATGLTAEQRGYSEVVSPSNYECYAFGAYNNPKCHQFLVLQKDDCAMACDNESKCKSFQVFQDQERGGTNSCFLFTDTFDGMTSTTQNDRKFANGTRKFIKPPSKVPDAETRLYAKPMNAGYYSRDSFLDSNIRRNFGDTSKIADMDKAPMMIYDRLYCQMNGNAPDFRYCAPIPSGNPNGIENYPTGMLVATGVTIGAGQGELGAVPFHTGVKACKIPGLVAMTQPTNASATDEPEPGCRTWNECNANDVAFNCGYNKLNNDWIIQNWDNLQNHLVNTLSTNVNAVKPRMSSVNDSIEVIQNVDSVKVAKSDYCKSVPLSTFVNDSTNSSFNRCSEFIQSQKNIRNIDEWYNFLLDRASKEDWRSAPSLVSDSCNKSSSPSTKDGCISALNNLNISDPFSTGVVQSLNDINANPGQESRIIQKHKDQVNSYCQKHQDREECSCRNAVEFGIAKCKPGIKGCEDMVEFQKLAESIDQNTALSTFIEKLEPRKLASACQRADVNTDGKLLRYGVESTKYIQLNNCILNLKNQGTINANNIVQKCEIFTAENDVPGAGGGAGGGGAGGGDDEKTSSWVWILLIAVIFLSLIGVAGIGIFALS